MKKTKVVYASNKRKEYVTWYGMPMRKPKKKKKIVQVA